ncbi:type VI secretion system baseplate subunit TssE [Neisseria sp. Dent CA1/247]|uniref:Type VI secretion protein n=1 Tax=Neisseria zoodegmatis TaxID=326523 RepID=A0A1X3CRU4_9NEIS|nr:MULTISPECIES: type VI secretion system baseplate subunit TssE [Neisseria]MDO5068844.1 type VI secretion system baseplate subunit TssE [Neisseria zoodegmatis]OSI10489.1 type VI secretion protein [Neisseria zoodegmatis]UOO76612.1 type VI secretion system baseplate subunit TssE [Neisseria sp. Dent CA1/247]SNU79193.1 type VI secretion system lysozyme-like protein [Neisseria zoodegmatis]SUA44297.1 type VI secretion system lysozyme-like protein [Neisseria zoodegmatis]
MEAGLYEKLTGYYSDGQRMEDLPDSLQLIKSVLDNMQRILNTRSGALKHIPDYGIPDLSMVYKNLPSSAKDLRSHMHATLLKYEPRLTGLDIRLTESKDNLMILCYQLECRIEKVGAVVIDTYFMPEGVVNVRQTKR